MTPTIDEIIHAIYACVTSDTAMHRCLELLTVRFRGLSAALIYQDEMSTAASFGFGYGVLDEAAQRRYREKFARYDPAPAAMAALPLGSVATTGQMLDIGNPRYAYFLRNFYYPLGLREALGGPIAQENGLFGIVAVQRGDDRNPFDAEDVSTFRRLMPHFMQSVRIRRMFFQLQQQARDLSAVMDVVGPGILVLGPGGRLVQANLAARVILNRRDGIVLNPDGSLLVRTEADPDRYENLQDFDDDIQDLGRSVRAVPRCSGAGSEPKAFPYTLRLSKSGPGQTGASVIVRVHDPDRQWPGAAQALTAAFSLSAPAAALTVALVAGADLATYAMQAGISLNTVKFHLKAAFAATGTSRQADLVRRALPVISDIAG